MTASTIALTLILGVIIFAAGAFIGWMMAKTRFISQIATLQAKIGRAHV